MKKILRVIIIIVVILLVLSILKNQIIKSVVSGVSSNVCGARVTIGGFSFGVLSQQLQISNLKVYNPQGFSRSILIDIQKVFVNFDLFSMIKGKQHLYRVDINLKELVLEKNKEGKLNVDSLSFSKEGEAKKPQEEKSAKQLPMQIDLLNLEVGRIIYKDYSQGKEEQIRAYDINLKKSYKNITSAQQLALLILTEPMKQAGIKSAKIYGIAMVAGVAVLPVAIVSQFTAKDSVVKEFDVDFRKLYDVSLDVLRRTGKINKENSSEGIIVANADGATVTVKFRQISSKTTQVTISARKFMLPRFETANGILYQISEQIKK